MGFTTAPPDIPTHPFALGSDGDIPGVNLIRLRGLATNSRAVLQSIWADQSVVDIGLLSSAATVKVSSTNANDTSAGSGARTVLITGLDSSGVFITETVTLNGQTAVTTTATWSAINYIEVLTAGTRRVNEGELWVGNGTVTAGVPDTKYLWAEADHGLSKTSAYTVPAGKNAVLKHMFFTINDTNKVAAIDLHVRSALLEKVYDSFHTTAGFFNSEAFAADPIPAGSMIDFQAVLDVGNAALVVVADIIEYDV